MMIKNFSFWLIIIISAVVLVALAMFGIKPLIINNLNAWQEIKTLKEEENDLKQRQSALNKLTTNREQITNYVTSLKEILPTEKNTGDFAIQIEAMASEYSLNLATLSVETESKKQPKRPGTKQMKQRNQRLSPSQPPPLAPRQQELRPPQQVLQ